MNKSKRSRRSSPKVYSNKTRRTPPIANRKRTIKPRNVEGRNSSKTSRPLKAELVERNRIVDFALKFKGTPYRYGGKTPESGFDCSGLVYYAYRHFNYSMISGSTNQARLGKRTSAKKAAPGDLLFFGDSKRVSHVGIVSYNDGSSLKMVHSSSSKGVIEEDINQSTYWKSRFLYARNVISDLPLSGNASLE